MSENKCIKMSVRPEILTKASPDFEVVEHKAVAGISEIDAINKNVIAEYEEPDNEPEDEDDDE